MLSKLFPVTDYTKLQYDTQGLYSITHPKEANDISKIIINELVKLNITDFSILDGTGGIGGNTFSFSKYFNKITTIELDNIRYNMLINNTRIYNLKNINIKNENSVEYLYNNYSNYKIYYFDPPWGGPDYKKKNKITLLMGSKTLVDIIIYLKKVTRRKLLVYKLPFNYNFSEFNMFSHKMYKVRNYFIVIIKI